MSENSNEVNIQTLSQTENYSAWVADEPDGETTVHLQLNNVTVHFYKEEWDEFLALIKNLK